MTKKDIIEFIPIGVLTVFSIYSVIEVLTTDFIFNGQQFVGLTMLGISLVFFFINRRIYKYLFGVTLLLGLLNLIGFTTTILTMNILFIPIQVLMVPVLLLFTWINKDQVIPKLKFLLGTTEEIIESESNSKVAGFKKRFKNLPNEEIENRLNQKLMPEAHEALKQIQVHRARINNEG